MIEEDEKNFAMFELVNEQRNYEETLLRECNEIEARMREYQESLLIRIKQQEDVQKELETKYNKIRSDLDFVSVQEQRNLKQLDNVRCRLRVILDKTDCDENQIQTKLGSTTGPNRVKMHNLYEYLQLLEESLNQYLNAEMVVEARKNEDGYRGLMRSRKNSVKVRSPSIHRLSLFPGFGNSSLKQPELFCGVTPPEIVLEETSTTPATTALHDNVKPMSRKELLETWTKAETKRSERKTDAIKTAKEIVDSQHGKTTKPTNVPSRSVDITKGSKPNDPKVVSFKDSEK